MYNKGVDFILQLFYLKKDKQEMVHDNKPAPTTPAKLLYHKDKKVQNLAPRPPSKNGWYLN